MITLSRGLEISFIILELLRNDETLKEKDIYVRCFHNRRENGLTFTALDTDWTFCVYEHRNSDQIIINGKKGYTSLCGELPYKEEGDKWDYFKSFKYDQYHECYVYLRGLLFYGI